MAFRILAIVALAAAGCGSTSGFNAAAYRSDGLAVGQAVERHRASADALASASDCKAEVQRYQDEVLPRLQQMGSMSETADECLRSLGDETMADMAASCLAAQEELQRHAAQACQASDMAVNRAEIADHCDRMAAFASEAAARCDMMMSRMSGPMGDMMGGPACR